MFEHFLKYQSGAVRGYPSYKTALHEITVEHKKSSHWIWYTIPYDHPSRQHGDLFVVNKKDVPFYLQNTQLNQNYIEMMRAIYELLKDEDSVNYENFISGIDLNKIYYSAILFRKNCSSANNEVTNVCDKIKNLLHSYILRSKATQTKEH